jgi:hypothetical protein
VKKSADEKRWAILPPPSAASAVRGQFAVQMDHARRRPARRTVSGEVRVDETEATDSSVNELEPSDSDRVTEVPSESRPRFNESNLETIPAPAWDETE